MESIQDFILNCREHSVYRYVLSAPAKDAVYEKTVISRIDGKYQCEQYTVTQVFHRNLREEELAANLQEQIGPGFTQVHAWDETWEYALRISKKGKLLYNRTRTRKAPPVRMTHNRKKQYLLEEGTVIPPLVDMGVFTSEGKIVRSHYDKYRQINRFVEILEDELKRLDLTKTLRILDFGCGKSYLTFIVYYYLVYVRKLKVDMTGLDLKEDVIRNCNAAAARYGYEGLHFELGNINGYSCDTPVDIVMTLHACDTATDYALYNALQWQAGLILSVPCCQHELNRQIQTDNFSAMTRYGIIKERMAALMTDAIRANLLICAGYDTSVLEFVDLSHTPKNLLIRAVKTNVSEKKKQQAMNEIQNLIKEFSVRPTLYELLYGEENDQKQ